MDALPSLISKPRSSKEDKEFPCEEPECRCGFKKRRGLMRHYRQKHAHLFKSMKSELTGWLDSRRYDSDFDDLDGEVEEGSEEEEEEVKEDQGTEELSPGRKRKREVSPTTDRSSPPSKRPRSPVPPAPSIPAQFPQDSAMTALVAAALSNLSGSTSPRPSVDMTHEGPK